MMGAYKTLAVGTESRVQLAALHLRQPERENKCCPWNQQQSQKARMCVCVYACMRWCMYVCMHACMYVMCVCMYECMYVCLYVCMYVPHVCMYVCMYVCLFVCVIQYDICQSIILEYDIT